MATLFRELLSRVLLGPRLIRADRIGGNAAGNVEGDDIDVPRILDRSDDLIDPRPSPPTGNRVGSETDESARDLMRRDRHDAYLAAAHDFCSKGGFLIPSDQEFDGEPRGTV